MTVDRCLARDFNYRPPTSGTDTFEAVATDGVTGHEARALINVNVVNDPPVIMCPSLAAPQDTPVPVPSMTAYDPNNDPMTVELDSATAARSSARRGLVLRPGGEHRAGSFVLHASDGD